MSCGIYKIENLTNHKVYIGQSVKIEKRWADHKSSAFNTNSKRYDYPLYRSIRKYGLDNFEFSILEVCDYSELDDKERYWIKQYNSIDNQYGYNQDEGGYCSHGIKLSLSDVEEIIQLLLHSDLTQAEIAEEYGVSRINICNINTGSIWRNMEYTYPLRGNLYFTQFGEIATRAEQYYCLDCGVKISKGSQRCLSCAQKHNGLARRVVDRPNKNDLKILIRSSTFVDIAKTYGVSDSTIKKWCRFYNLPDTKYKIKSYSDEEWDLL